MKYGICQVSVAPLRAEPSDSSEMISQLLFGEKVSILDSKEKWLSVKLDFDGYEGWIDPKQILWLTEEEYNSIQNPQFAIDAFNLAVENDLPITLTIGAELPNLQNNNLKIGSKNFEYIGEFSEGNLGKDNLINLAKNYLNVPYLWGGKSTFGIDCSGLVQQVYKLAGYKLPRDAYQQAEHGEALSFIEEAEAGDLAFFENQSGKIIHVGIIMEGGKIIHAHGKVRIDPVDITGIFNTDSQQYSHQLRFIKKII